MLPFGAVTTKPDFAKLKNVARQQFVEFKYPKLRPSQLCSDRDDKSSSNIPPAGGSYPLHRVRSESGHTKRPRVVEDFEKNLDVWVGIAR